MDNITLTPIEDIDAYAVSMDSDCINQDYDVADDFQYQLEQLANEEDCDILFE